MSQVDKLKAEIYRLKKELKEKKKYGLVWEDKPEDVVEMCKTKLPVLKEVKSKEILTDKNKPVNLLIEGDNYHALSVLNYTHKGKIDVIYIDPPYNKGSKDFKYNDVWVDAEDSYRHSKWLSFMSKRLQLAKPLLKKGGVIFISIDDNELAQLKLSCNGIFGEQNFVGTITWEKRTKAQNTETAKEMLQSKTEYILVYKKEIDKIRFKLEVFGEKKYGLQDDRGLYRLKLIEEMSARGMRGRQTMIFPIKGIKPRNGYQWKFGKDQIDKFKCRNDIEILDGKPYFKMRPQDEVKQKFIPFWSHFFDKDTYGTAEKGKSELTEILGNNEHEFETVKPINLIKKLLFHINRNGNEIVLDFFAGSGTTGHAVLNFNDTDQGKRTFILCTNNEENICTDICYPRVQKAIKGYKSPKGKKIDGLGGNLKYFKTDFVEAEPNDGNKMKLTEQATEMLCIKENTFELVLNRKKFKIFKNNNQYTGIIFDQMAIPQFKKAIQSTKAKFSVYIFSLSDDTFDEEFENIKQKVKLSPIPETILRVYRRIFK